MSVLSRNLVCFLLSLQCLLHSASCLKSRRTEANQPEENHIDWVCSSDEECSARGSKCIDLECQCSAGHVFSSDMTSCLKVATKFGDQCIEDIQCSRYLLSGGQCRNNGCACAKGYYYMHGRCNPHSELFGRCKKDHDCYVHADFEASVCHEGLCKCSPGYYQREYRTCRRSSKEFGDFCTVNADCHFDEEAYCSNQLKCEKKEEHFGGASSSSATSGGLPGEEVEDDNDDGIVVGGRCEREKDCESLGGAECRPEGVCACKRGHFPSKNKDQCIPELGEACLEGDTEGIKNSVCRNKRWACKGNAVVSRDRQKCRKVSRAVGESCLEDEQCSALGPDAYCESRKCACNGNSHYLESEEFCWVNKAYGQACQQDFDCYENGFNGSLYCMNSACSCPNGTRLHSNGLECVTSSAEIGMRCESNSDCIAENALCHDDLCRCPDNYYEINKECWPGVNASCRSDEAEAEACRPENAVCLSGKCQCQEGFVGFSVESCLPVVSMGKACLQHVQCDAATPNSHCIARKDDAGILEKVCQCLDGYYFKSGGCFRKRLLGEACKSRDDCYLLSDIELAICLNGFCACNWGYVPANLTLCTKARDIHPYSNSGGVGLLAASPFKILPSILLVWLANYFSD